MILAGYMFLILGERQMLKGTYLGIALILLLVSASSAMIFRPVNAQGGIVDIRFENGLNEITKTMCNNFVVRVYIALDPGTRIDFWEMEIHWDTRILELQTGTINDVVEGSFMKAFGNTVFVVQDPNNTAGVLPSIACGFLSGGSASGSGILFTMNFHLKGGNSREGLITIFQPGVESYLLFGQDLVPFTAIDGLVHFPIPPSAWPDAEFSPETGAYAKAGLNVTLNGSASRDGYDVFPAPGNICPITDWTWKVDEGNDGSIEYTLNGEITTYTHTPGFAGTVGITLTVLALDPIPPTDNETYIDYNSEKPVIRICKVGDIGGSVPPQFFSFDDKVDGKDLALFLQCYKGTTQPEAMY
jgi:hypothetical protein